MRVRYVCQREEENEPGKEKRGAGDDARGGVERGTGHQRGRRVFEKLKKNRGGVYRSRGWKNFSDGGF